MYDLITVAHSTHFQDLVRDCNNSTDVNKSESFDRSSKDLS